MFKRPKEVIFEEEGDESAKGGNNGDDEIVVDSESEDDEIVVEASKAQKLKEGLVTMSRRRLLGIGLAGLGALALGGYLVLREKGPKGSELMTEYERIAGVQGPNAKNKLTPERLRHMYVLEQVAAGNMPSTYDDFVTIEAKGARGTLVRFEATPHPLRIGHNDDWIEVPLDGYHAMAATEILGYELPMPWMVEAIYRQAIKVDEAEKKKPQKDRKPTGKVKFYGAPEIAQFLELKDWKPNDPDGWWQKSPQFIRARNALLHKWLAEHKIDNTMLISGGTKEVCTPNPAKNRRLGFSRIFHRVDDPKQKVRLEFEGGYNDQGVKIQGLSGGIHTANYFDYSHGIRFIKSRKIEVQEKGSTEWKTMTWEEFHQSVKYAQEFMFDKTEILARAYPYTPELMTWMKDRGYYHEEERGPKKAETEKPDAGATPAKTPKKKR